MHVCMHAGREEHVLCMLHATVHTACEGDPKMQLLACSQLQLCPAGWPMACSCLTRRRPARHLRLLGLCRPLREVNASCKACCS
jgi:hypothetical protein